MCGACPDFQTRLESEYAVHALRHGGSLALEEELFVEDVRHHQCRLCRQTVPHNHAALSLHMNKEHGLLSLIYFVNHVMQPARQNNKTDPAAAGREEQRPTSAGDCLNWAIGSAYACQVCGGNRKVQVQTVFRNLRFLTERF